jgi:hypothetical protein
MSDSPALNRRSFLGNSVAALAAGSAVLATGAEGAAPTQVATAAPANPPAPHPSGMAYGMIGKVKISRMMLGGNLVSGFMHCRDLKYVPQLFRAYVTEEKIFETFKVCEENGINTVFESGGAFVQRYNRERGGHMQIIPSVHPAVGQSDTQIKDEVKQLVDGGVPAIYVWGVASDQLVRAGKVGMIAKTVEIIKSHGLPAGVGGHSLQVPMACEKIQVPCDFYVKTLHTDDYPTAIPKAQRKEYIWIDGGPGFYDNMWCINPEETVAFMKTVRKPWIAFKVLAAGAILPKDGFSYAFRNGADFIAVGMFDFQIKANCEIVNRVVRNSKTRPRPWYS